MKEREERHTRNVPPRIGLEEPAEVLRRLDLAVSRRLDGLLQGDHRGLVPGHGSESGEARLYQDGDDVRRIDWNVTARSQAPHVRETIADRELETWLLVDLSPSLDFGTALCTKRDLAVAAAAAVGFLTARTGNRVGAVILAGGQLSAMPARSGRTHLQAILHRLITTPTGDGGGATDLASGIDRLAIPSHRRGLAVVISDFLAPEGWEQPLRRVGVRHETLGIEIVDPRELELPHVGMLSLVDPETGRRREIQTADAKLRARYAAAAADQRAGIAVALRAAAVDHLQLRTDRDWLLDLVRFVAYRRQRVDHVEKGGALMHFLYANRLLLLLAVAALAIIYIVLQRRNHKYEVRFTNLALLDVVAPKRPGWRRHATALAFLLGASVLIIAFAEPVRDVKVPKERATVVLAIDTSLSMEATDVAPTRIRAAQAAAGDFLDAVPESMNVGLVTFDGVARVQVTPTTDRELIRRAIANLTLHESTAIGEAIFLSLDAIKAVPPGPDGEAAPARIVLMSDGKTTVGRANEDAGAAAKKANVPISTIAFGTPDGEIRVNDDPLPVLVPVEPEPLRALARQTGGSFFEADSIEGLGDVYKDIGSSIGYTVEERDVSSWFIGAALIALLLTAGLSLLWFARLP